MSAERRAPDTAAAVREILGSRGLGALRRYGQHFMVRPAVLDRMVELAGVGRGDVVLEVGPGLGALTERLLEAGAEVVAVEIDRGLCAFLEELFAPEERLLLLHRDVMTRKSAIDPAVLAALADRGAFGAAGGRVVSNLPYGISSPFLIALTSLPVPPPRCVLTVQQEVAETLLAAPGTASYTALSFAARLYWRVRRDRRLPPEGFHPRPRVDSALVVLEAVPRTVSPAELLPFARRLFRHRRKALRGTLAPALSELLADRGGLGAVELLEACGVDPRRRVGEVPPEVIEELWLRARGGL